MNSFLLLLLLLLPPRLLLLLLLLRFLLVFSISMMTSDSTANRNTISLLLPRLMEG